MIYGVGSDIIEIHRIAELVASYGPRFLDRVFTPKEQAYAYSKKGPMSRLANRFAAKEAFLKALGTGLSQGASWKEIEILNDTLGQPSITLSGKTLDILKSRLKADYRIHCTLSDSAHYSQAFVLIETL